MNQSIIHVALVVRDYDETIKFYCNKLHFKLIEDTYQPEQDKRWVVVAPPGSNGTNLLLARASTPEQEAAIGNQTGGRVFLFLRTDDFWRDYNEMLSVGINFVREPKNEPYGTVAVFEDLYGNMWDLIEPSQREGNLDITPASKQRLPEYQQDDAWIVDFLKTSKIGHIATRWEEQPFITPSTFWYDEGQHQIIFHSNSVGRIRTNVERHPEVCFETSHYGRFLPSNIALEFSLQYESVIVFGKIRIIEAEGEKRRGLYGLIEKYFPGMKPGEAYRPITDKELNRTSLYAIEITSWSGKRNWEGQAEQSDEWFEQG
jgi:nitroimidazol reductase NimA-like FMN-containing flavoprotein (pyridoxamine 5'-phosphate oxidase superfamily)/uncharacterized glyoxalase superfamily protein PhnB